MQGRRSEKRSLLFFSDQSKKASWSCVLWMKPGSPLGDAGPLLYSALDLVSACPSLVLEREGMVTSALCVPAVFFLVLVAEGVPILGVAGHAATCPTSNPIPGGRLGSTQGPGLPGKSSASST